MADVIVTFRVMPKGVEINLEDLAKKIANAISPEKIEREPIAFGLEALIITKIIPDAGGELEKIETSLRAIEEVSEVDVIKITRAI